MKFLRELVVAPIRFYQKFLSPLKPPMCRFEPTCSTYAIEAIRVHGVLRGVLLGTWRILRCQPFSKGGLDPVPPRSSGGRRTAREAPESRPDPPPGD